MILSIVVAEDFPMKLGEVLRVKLPQSPATERITIRGVDLTNSRKGYTKYTTTSRVTVPSSNKPHISTRDMRSLPRYASIGHVYYKD